ncbi:hypothetical protein EP47_11660 [Legionella norrlandica]|uniref:Uncharacterized protein n=1 Tax=Legionella norrlandica TaxID=1498499 RepID=A0A0A2SUK4_9GAMM|nr:hypothetical protein [Legionella norrlandica]KGP64417.1 hypothetical protein EP47_11660 [Legionella norrlandica]
MRKHIIIELAESVFVGCQEKSYLKKMQKKAWELDLYDADQLTPEILEQSPYKLHVSLQNEEYTKHKEKIKEIIITHLEGGAINDFKFIDDNTLRDKMNSEVQIVQWIAEYKNMVAKNEKPGLDWENNFLCAINDYFGCRIDSIPDKTDIEKILTRITILIKDGQRLLDGDQFTIYIPENFDRDMIFRLCCEINTYLEQNNVTPGKLLDIESPIGNYINLRQEFLIEDFHSVNREGVIDRNKKIDSVKIHNDALENDRRKRVVLEQEQSNLYQYIIGKFPKSPNLQNASAFFQPTPEKEEVVNSTKKLDCSA